MSHFPWKFRTAQPVLIAVVAVSACVGCSGPSLPTVAPRAATERAPSSTPEQLASDSSEASPEKTDVGASKPTVSSEGDRKLSWKVVDAHLAVVKNCRYCPTRNDWDKGDKHFAQKLSSLLEELKGREVLARLNLVERIVAGDESDAESEGDAMLGLVVVKQLFEKLGAQPSVSDRKVSWEKLEAMLKDFPASVTRKDWKAGDQKILAKLDDLHQQYENIELAVMQQNAFLAATNQQFDTRKLLAVSAHMRKLEQIMKEIHSPGQAD